MDASTTLQRQRYPARLLVVVIALASAFLLGGASGYVTKALTTPSTTSAPAVITVPAGTPKQTILPNRT
jgi:hypothetical protein